MHDNPLSIKLLNHVKKSLAIGLVEEETYEGFTAEEGRQISALCKKLYAAGLLDSKSRGIYILTEKGKRFLESKSA